MASKIDVKAWDCMNNLPIPADKEAEIFEEIATRQILFEGIDTVPPRKDMDHLVFFCEGVRYRVQAQPSATVEQVQELLFKGGITRANKPGKPGAFAAPSDICLQYAGEWMEAGTGRTLDSYGVPPGCGVLIAMRKDKRESGKPDPDSAYWN